MENKHITIAATGITLLSLGAQLLPTLLVEWWTTGEMAAVSGWVPTLGTIGQTITFYSIFVSIIGVIITLGLAGILGYQISKHRHIVTEFPAIALATLAGSVAAILVAAIALLLYGSPVTVEVFDVVIGVMSFLDQVVSVAVVILAATVTGAVIGHRTHRAGRPPNTAATADSRSQADFSD